MYKIDESKFSFVKIRSQIFSTEKDYYLHQYKEKVFVCYNRRSFNANTEKEVDCCIPILPEIRFIIVKSKNVPLIIEGYEIDSTQEKPVNWDYFLEFLKKPN